MSSPKQSLTAQATRGFAWAFTGTVSQAMLQIVSVVVLAHLLTKQEFGMATAAGLIVGLSQVISQMGVGPALVQRKELNPREVSAAFWFSVLFSIVLAAVIWVATPFINPLIGLPEDSSLLRLLTVALVLAGAAATPLGLLQRDLRLRPMAMIDVVASGPGVIGVSVALALLGAGAASLVLGQIAGALIQCVGYHRLARPHIRPEPPARMWQAVRPLLRFGSGYSLSQLGNWFALNADNFTVANRLGTDALGVYGRAYTWLVQPATIIGTAADKVLFPAMAKVRDDGEKLRVAYVRSASLVALVTLPCSALLFALAPEIVRILLGPKWLEVVLPLQVFALVLMPRTSYKISGSLTRATGAVYGGAWRQWLYAAEVLVGALIGARWGVGGVAVGASIAIVLHFLTMLHFSGRVAPGLMSSVLRSYVKHVPIAVVSFVTAWGAASLLRHATDVALLTVAGTVACWGAATGVTVLLLRRPFDAEIAIILSMIGRGRRGATPAPSAESIPEPSPEPPVAAPDPTLTAALPQESLDAETRPMPVVLQPSRTAPAPRTPPAPPPHR